MKIYLLQKVYRASTCLSFWYYWNLGTHWNVASDSKEITENTNDRSETKFASVGHPLIMNKTASNETNVVSDIPNQLKRKMSLLHQGKEKQAKKLRRVSISISSS